MVQVSQAFPSVSLVVCAYNQERYVAEAVASALAQQCPPITILLSDDCSQDATFDVLRRLANAYTGPHRLVINRNPRRMGISAHVHRCWELTDTEWVIWGAGDDLSTPQRVATIADVIRRFPSLDGIGSSAQHIRADGAPMGRLGIRERSRPLLPKSLRLLMDQSTSRHAPGDRVVRYLLDGFPFVLGATAAWRRNLVARYGKMNDRAAEDYVLNFRAALGGGVHIIRQPLISYRIHDANVWSSDESRSSRAQAEARRLGRLAMLLAGIDQNQEDVETLLRRSEIAPGLADKIFAILEARRRLADIAIMADPNTAESVGSFLVSQGLKTRAQARAASARLSRARAWAKYLAESLIRRLTR